MKSRTTIVGVYGPVLLAAVLILTIAPTCIMPSCSGVAAASSGACDQPVTSRFKSACEIEIEPTNSAPAQPCHDENSECDTTMTHGTQAAVPVANVSVPDISTVVTLVDVPDAMILSFVASTVVSYDAHPPDPLGVRLIV